MLRICFVSFLLIFLLSFNVSFAEVSSPTPTPKVNYELVYPGLLPDSPIYFLKIIRDKTVGFLIADPLKKAEFNLLQADKRLNAGIFLFDKNKILLALSTISKAENYFFEAVQKIKDAKVQGVNIENMTKRLMEASQKHKEELAFLKEKSAKEFQDDFAREETRVAKFIIDVESLISKR